MNKALTGLVAVAFAFGATAPVFAASASTHTQKATADTCQSMAAEVDQAMSAHPNAKKLDLAKKRQGEGDKLCSDGKYSEGVSKYKLALSNLTGNSSKK